MSISKVLQRRFDHTTSFLQESVPAPANILDLGTPNQLSEIIQGLGYEVENTGGQDLDLDWEIVKTADVDVVTAFEIFEHMVAPFNLLRAIKAPQLVATIPLNLWFARAYWNEKDPWDRHYHEFEDRQFDMLLDKSGWKIEKSIKWKSPSPKIGIRPFLRGITPRYYGVYCTRK